jgi:sugar phosphate isomerase/epimerase
MTHPVLRSRRQILAGLGVAAAAAMLPLGREQPHAAAGASMSSGPKPASTPWVFGLQLYTLEDAPAKDLNGTLKTVADIGYRTVELPQAYGKSAAALRQAIDAVGLSCPAIHALPRASEGSWDIEGDVSRLADDVYTLGAAYVVVPAPRYSDALVEALKHPPEGGFNTTNLAELIKMLKADDWKRTADLLNEKAAILARSGIRLAYHNHGFDFSPVDHGKSGFDILLERTDPKLVDFELDVGWATVAAQDIRGLFQRAQGRIRLLHLKDAQKPSSNPLDLASADVGQGIVDWRGLFTLIRETKVRHLFVEQEAPWNGTTPMQAVRAGYAYLSQNFGTVKA